MSRYPTICGPISCNTPSTIPQDARTKRDTPFLTEPLRYDRASWWTKRLSLVAPIARCNRDVRTDSLDLKSQETARKNATAKILRCWGHRSGPLLENGLDRPENRYGRYLVFFLHFHIYCRVGWSQSFPLKILCFCSLGGGGGGGGYFSVPCEMPAIRTPAAVWPAMRAPAMPNR